MGRDLPCHQEGIVQMSNGLNFLENMGRSANLRHASAQQLQHAMRGQQIAPAMQLAILNQDQAQVEMLLDARNKIYCALMTPKPKRAPPKPGKAPKKAPGKKPAKKPAKPGKAKSKR
ncbi:MAG TPA: hypothetical protein VFI49_01735 [Rudaea sp.]|nr:hypothetical protein [Rudaea sp.]